MPDPLSPRAAASDSRAVDIATRATARLDDVDTRILTEFPISACLAALAEQSPDANYHAIPDRVKSHDRAVADTYGEKVAEDYNRLLVATLAEDLPSRSANLPRSVLLVLERETTRILAGIDGGPYGQHRWEHDVFVKDLQSLRLRLIPCGAGVVDLRPGISRRMLITGGVGQLLRGLLLLTRLRGFSRCYEMHTHTPTLFEFHEAGWNECYLRIADLLRQSPDIQGIFRASWFCDPALDKISPELSYLRKRPLENGAHLFRVGRTESRNPIALSPVRRKLYEEGTYVPTIYMIIWPRRELLQWASS